MAKLMSRRDFLSLSALAAAGSALAACTTKEVIKTVEIEKQVVVTQRVEVEKTVVVVATPPPPGVKKVTIFTGFGAGGDANQQKVHAGLVEDFNSTHPSMDLHWLHIPFEQRMEKYQTMVAADQAPELAGPIGVGGIAGLLAGLLDIEPLIDADGYDLSDYTSVELMRTPLGLVGLPLGLYPSALYYNEDLFDAAGVDYPPHKYGEKYADGDDWTYEKAFEIAKLLTIDSAGNDASSPAFDWEETLQWGWNGWDWMGIREVASMYGGVPIGITDDYKTVVMDSPEYVEAMQALNDSCTKWHIWANYEQGGAFYDLAGEPVGSGLTAMWEQHTWVLDMAIGTWIESFNWDVAAVPTAVSVGEPVALMDGPSTFVVATSSHNPEAGWEVIKWLYEPERYLLLCRNYNIVPSRKSLVDNFIPDMEAKEPGHDYQVFLDGIQYADSPNHEGWMPNYMRVFGPIGVAWDTLRNESVDVEAVMADMNAEVQGLVDEWWELYPDGWW